MNKYLHTHILCSRTNRQYRHLFSWANTSTDTSNVDKEVPVHALTCCQEQVPAQTPTNTTMCKYVPISLYKKHPPIYCHEQVPAQTPTNTSTCRHLPIFMNQAASDWTLPRSTPSVSDRTRSLLFAGKQVHTS